MLLHGDEVEPIEPVLAPRLSDRLLGLLVLEVEPGSPAEAAGIAVGDVLIGAGGRSFNGPYDLARALRNADRASGVEIDFIRGGRRVTRDVRLPVRPVTSER